MRSNQWLKKTLSFLSILALLGCSASSQEGGDGDIFGSPHKTFPIKFQFAVYLERLLEREDTVDIQAGSSKATTFVDSMQQYICVTGITLAFDAQADKPIELFHGFEEGISVPIEGMSAALLLDQFDIEVESLVTPDLWDLKSVAVRVGPECDNFTDDSIHFLFAHSGGLKKVYTKKVVDLAADVTEDIITPTKRDFYLDISRSLIDFAENFGGHSIPSVGSTGAQTQTESHTWDKGGDKKPPLTGSGPSLSL